MTDPINNPPVDPSAEIAAGDAASPLAQTAAPSPVPLPAQADATPAQSSAQSSLPSPTFPPPPTPTSPSAGETASTELQISPYQPQPADPKQAQIDDLLRRIIHLESRARLADSLNPWATLPFKQVFPADVSGVQWQEKCVEGGTIQTFTGGRVCSANTNSAALLSLATNQAVLLEIMDPAGAMRYIPIGGPIVFNEWRDAVAVLFAVRVEKDGGSDGTAATPASWTYTVRDATGAIELGTEVTLARPRPNGKMIFQAGTFEGEDAGFGLAFYAGGALQLWDAGEVPDTGACT